MNANTLSSVLFRWLRQLSIPCAPERAVARPTTSRVLLKRHQVMNLSKEFPAHHIEVQRGAIWLTETPAAKDIVLQATEHLGLNSGHPFVIEALTEAEVILTR